MGARSSSDADATSRVSATPCASSLPFSHLLVARSLLLFFSVPWRPRLRSIQKRVRRATSSTCEEEPDCGRTWKESNHNLHLHLHQRPFFSRCCTIGGKFVGKATKSRSRSQKRLVEKYDRGGNLRAVRLVK